MGQVKNVIRPKFDWYFVLDDYEKEEWNRLEDIRLNAAGEMYTAAAHIRRIKQRGEQRLRRRVSQEWNKNVDRLEASQEG